MPSALRTIATIFLLLSSAAAQATTLPQCAIGCGRTTATRVGCALSDTPCLCKTSFASSVVQCAGMTSCSAAEKTEVGAILASMCIIASGSASASRSSRSSASATNPSVTVPIGASTPLTFTTVTSTVTSVSSPLTIIFTSAVTVIPPLSSIPSSALPSSSSSNTNATSSTTGTFPGSSPATSPSPSPSPSPSTAAAAGTRARVAGVVGAIVGIGVGVL